MEGEILFCIEGVDVKNITVLNNILDIVPKTFSLDYEEYDLREKSYMRVCELNEKGFSIAISPYDGLFFKISSWDEVKNSFLGLKERWSLASFFLNITFKWNKLGDLIVSFEMTSVEKDENDKEPIVTLSNFKTGVFGYYSD